MASTITLTEEQRNAVNNDMDRQIEMLSNEEVEYLATRLNGNIDIPFIGEGREQTILVKIVKKMDRFLYDALPNELYGLIKDSTDGINDEEADQMTKVLSSRANKSIDIKYLPEWVEQEIFEFLLKLIVNAMRKNMTIFSS